MKDFQPHKSCLFVLQNVRDIFTSATSFTRKDLRFFLFSIVFIRYFCFTFSAAYFEGPTPPPLRNGLDAADALTDNGHGLPPGYAVGLEWGSRMRTTPPPEMPPPTGGTGIPATYGWWTPPPTRLSRPALPPPLIRLLGQSINYPSKSSSILGPVRLPESESAGRGSVQVVVEHRWNAPSTLCCFSCPANFHA